MCPLNLKCIGTKSMQNTSAYEEPRSLVKSDSETVTERGRILKSEKLN